ncbi:hypothetical protein N9P76_00055 [Amylibacter sp.]|nr:hypothetical protein [Amylibacter sp.]
MASSIVENIIRLKSMLGDMEQDFGLAELSSVEKNVYLAAQDIKSYDDIVETKHILDHTFTQKMSRPTFFSRAKIYSRKRIACKCA